MSIAKWVIGIVIALGLLGLGGMWVYGQMVGTSEVATPTRMSQVPAPTAPSTSTGKKAATSSYEWTATGTAVEGKFADADVVDLGDGTFRMYYATQPEVAGNQFEVYSATSSDGKIWTPESGQRKTMATFPEVVKLADGTFRMYFQSAGVIKSASSKEGLKWQDEAGTRIDMSNDEGLTFDNVAAPTVLLQSDGTFLMVYRGTVNEQYAGEMTPNKNTQLLLWATSSDGLSWTQKGLAIDTRVEPLYGLADGPELFVDDDGSTKLSFWTYTGVYWSPVSNGTFGEPSKVFALAESTSMNKFPAETPGDPVYAKIADTWYMYYGRPDGIQYAVRSK